MDIYANFGERLKAAREARGVSKSELERRSGITKSLIRRYEKGEILPMLYNAILLARSIDVSLDYLVGLSDTMDLS